MKHIKEEAFADFVRGTLGSGEQVTTERHLETCPDCRKAVEVWKTVYSVAQQEQSFQPPDDAVRIAKAFAANVPKPAHGRTLALVFDSLSSPSMAGMRGASGARQLLFTCEEVTIDVRLEQQTEKNRVFMVGQILHRATNQGVMGTMVSVLSGNQVIAETWSNQFGEFQLECRIQEKLTISIGSPSDYRMALPGDMN